MVDEPFFKPNKKPAASAPTHCTVQINSTLEVVDRLGIQPVLQLLKGRAPILHHEALE